MQSQVKKVHKIGAVHAAAMWRHSLWQLEQWERKIIMIGLQLGQMLWDVSWDLWSVFVMSLYFQYWYTRFRSNLSVNAKMLIPQSALRRHVCETNANGVQPPSYPQNTAILSTTRIWHVLYYYLIQHIIPGTGHSTCSCALQGRVSVSEGRSCTLGCTTLL